MLDPEMESEAIEVHLICKDYHTQPHKYYFPFVVSGHLKFAIDQCIWRIYQNYKAEQVKKQEALEKREKNKKLQRPR